MYQILHYIEMLNIALPKGRLGEKVYKLFQTAGYDCPDILDPNTRKLIFENPDKGIRFFWVKPSDVTVYVDGMFVTREQAAVTKE